jgi:serine/threonine-protein kinase
MVMTDEDRTTILSQGRTNAMPQQRGRHRPAALADDPEDYNPYEDEEEERRRKRRKGWLIALLTVLGVALIAVLIWLMSTAFGDEPASEQVAVPDVVGQVETDARAELQNRGFEVRIAEIFCQPTPTSEPGQCGPDSISKVVETNPAAGTKVSKSSVVVLRVGREAPKKTVPELSGKTPDEARTELEKAGLTLDPTTTEEEVEDDSLVGKIVAQDPPSGTQAAQGTPVKIAIGKAKEESSVPNLIGQDFETAKGNLENLGFTVKREEQSSDKPANQVIDQNPKDGEHEPGTEITLVVSKGDQQDDKISVPSLIGLSEQDAEQLLRQQGWTGSFDVEETDTQNPAEFDRIVEQEQGAGSQIDKDQDVGIIVGKPGIGGGR